MKLYISPGACSLSPHIVLRELKLSFEIATVDLRSKRTREGEDFRQVNPKGYVPALRLDGGEVLTEGIAILQYLADHYAPGTIAPIGGTIERARLDGHLVFLASELHKAVGPLFSPTLSESERKAALARAAQKYDILEGDLSDGRHYLGGNDFSIADVHLFVIAGWAPHLGIDLARWPRLEVLVRRIGARAAAKEAVAAEVKMREAA